MAYDGTGFRGWAAQRDPSIRTVEGELTAVLADVRSAGEALSGRQDGCWGARPRAGGLVRDPVISPAETIREAINSRLGPEVVALDVRDAREGFDARFSASARVYRYRIDLGTVPDPFDARFVWHHPGAPDLRAMRAAAAHLIGSHDFTSFCRHPGEGRPVVRDLQRMTIGSVRDRLELGFRANAFLHQMVRALTGTLAAVGEGGLDPEDDPGDPGCSRPLSSAADRAGEGLTLERVVYGPRDRRTEPFL